MSGLAVSAERRVEELIDSSPMRLSQWRAIGLCSIVAMLDGFDLQVMSFVAPIVSERFDFGPEVVGYLLSAALAGLMLGSFVASPFSDRFGRKPVIIAACLLMGTFSFLTAFAADATEFIAFRFLTGLGLGAALPNIQTLTSEIVPKRRRALLMTLMFLGFPAGAIFGGLGSTHIIAEFGWESLFVIGGVLPFFTAVLLFFCMDESFRWLASKKPNSTALLEFMEISRVSASNAKPSFLPEEPSQNLEPIAEHPLGANARVLTFFLWLLFFSNLMLLYTLLTWLPSLMARLGESLDFAIHAAVVFNIGGAAGGMFLAWLMDRMGGVVALTSAYVLAIMLLLIVAMLGLDGSTLMVGIFILGIPVAGTPFGVSALAASLYAPPVRGRGVGWALAVGRLGAVIGPSVAGYLLLYISVWELVLTAIIPVLLCLGSIVLLSCELRSVNSGRSRSSRSRIL